MSSAAPTSTADRKHRLTVAEGLLSSIGTGPLVLETTRKFLGLSESLSPAEARRALQGLVDELREDDSSADFPLLPEGTANDLPRELKPKRRKRRRPKKGAKMEEARVTGDPPVANSPSSQTGPEAAQNEAWGGANPAAAIRQLRAAGVEVTVPPNLRDADGWEQCGNCVFFLKGCDLYGVSRDGSKPDVVHSGQYPVDADDLCDSHYSLTPEAQRRVGALDREDARLAEAARAENGQAVARARARVAVAQERLDEALADDLEEVWSDASRAAALLARRQHRNGIVSPEARHVDKFGSSLLSRDHGESALHYAMRRLSDKPPSAMAGKVDRQALYGGNHPHPAHRRLAGVGVTHLAHSAVEEAWSDAARTASAAVRGAGTGGRSYVYAHPVGKHVWLDGQEHTIERSNQKTTQKSVRLKPVGGGASIDVHPGTVIHHVNPKKMEESSVLSEVKSDAYPGLDRSPKKNWVDKAGGLPSYIERIAKHLHYEKGKDIGHAIAIAVNVVKKMCASGDTNFPGKQSVNAKSRAEACAAVAQWEKKKGATSARGHAGNAARSAMQESFDEAYALFEEAFRPVPPSWAFIENLHREIAEADGSGWNDGLAELDEALALIDEKGIEEAAEQLEENVLKRLGVHFDAKRHPRAPKGRSGGGRFTRVLDKLHTDMAGHRHTAKEQMRAARQGRQLPSSAGAGQSRMSGTASATVNVAPDYKIGSAALKTVEQHFASGKREQGSSAPADLTVDMAIGGVLSSFPNVKNWKLDDPTADKHGKKTWTLHVALADGKTHHIDVDENGHVELAKKPAAKVKPVPADVVDYGKAAVAKQKATQKAAYAKIAAAHPEYEPTGDVNVVSHMEPGTVFKGDDGHLYKHHGDDWIAGKKGPVKAAHIENLETGVDKKVPYFALHGKEYAIHAPAGSFTPKAPGEKTSVDDAFDKIMSGLKHGQLDSVAGKSFVITGTVPGHTRNEVQAMITQAGGTNHSSVGSHTDVLINAGKSETVKIKKAKAQGVTVVSWDEVKHLLEAELGRDGVKLAVARVQLSEATAGGEISRLRARVAVLEEKTYNAAERRKHATVGEDGYPIGDREHANQALIRLNQGGLSAEEKAKVIAKAARHGASPALLEKRRKQTKGKA